MSDNLFKDEHNGIKPGGIITAYQKGFYKCVAIHRRFYQTERDIPGHLRHNIKVGDENSPLVEYIQVAKADGTLRIGKVKMKCDASWCAPAAVSIDKEVAQLETRIASLNAFKEKLTTL